MNQIKTDNKSLDHQAMDVLSILNRWSDRLEGHHSQKRETGRQPFRSPITIHIPGTENLPGECAEKNNFEAWARNISQSGLGFIYKGQIKASKLTICLNPKAEDECWFNVEIVRSRQVHNDFWEYGVKFIDKAEK